MAKPRGVKLAGRLLPARRRTKHTHSGSMPEWRDVLPGVPFFKTEAREFAREPETGADDLPVLRTKPGDVDFA